MGKPSDKRRAARRPGRWERAKVKRHHRTQGAGFVGGAFSYSLKAGRKKFRKVWAYLYRLERAHLAGDALTSKSVVVTKRPLYTVTAGPALQGHDMEPKGPTVGYDSAKGVES
jgi:hypothetical protein